MWSEGEWTVSLFTSEPRADPGTSTPWCPVTTTLFFGSVEWIRRTSTRLSEGVPGHCRTGSRPWSGRWWSRSRRRSCSHPTPVSRSRVRSIRKRRRFALERNPTFVSRRPWRARLRGAKFSFTSWFFTRKKKSSRTRVSGLMTSFRSLLKCRAHGAGRLFAPGAGCGHILSIGSTRPMGSRFPGIASMSPPARRCSSMCGSILTRSPGTST